MFSRLLLLASIASIQAAPAFAGQFNLAPTRIDLDEKHPTMLLGLSNTGEEPLRFQLTTYRWDQSEDEAVVLEPTDDIIVFPSFVTLAPGEKRNVRVGTTASFGDIEGTYRVFVEELPSLDSSGDLGVRVRTRAGIPIFLAPHHSSPELQVSDPYVAGAELAVTLTNSGNVHVMVQALQATSTCPGSAPRSAEVRGWYVLPGRARTMTLPLPPEGCDSAPNVDIRAVTDRGTWRVSAPLEDSASLLPLSE